VYRTRTITAALNYAKLNETDSEETIEIPNEAPEVVSEATAEVEVTEEDSVHTSQDEVTEEQVEEIAVEAAVQPIEEEPETVTEEIVSAENTEAVEAVQTEAPEETAQTEPEHTEQKKSKTAVAGYRENVKYALKKAKCKDKTVDEIAQMIATSTTKEELHNLLAKSYKSEATDLYKLIRPKYLRLKALYDEENPAVETAEAENTEVSEAAVATEEAVPTVEAVTEQETAEAPESKVIYTDTISVRLAELLVDKCTDEELVRVRSVFDSAVTKQQLYIRMVKEFRKEKGCEIYNAIRSEYTNLRKQAENTEVL
jgi:hypothetical protein